MNHGTLHHFESDVFPSVVLDFTRIGRTNGRFAPATGLARTASGLQKAGSRPDSSGKITCTRDNTRKVLLQFRSLLLQSDPAAVHYTTPAAIIGTLAANIPNNSEPNRVFQLAPLLILKIRHHRRHSRP